MAEIKRLTDSYRDERVWLEGGTEREWLEGSRYEDKFDDDVRAGYPDRCGAEPDPGACDVTTRIRTPRERS